MRTVLVTGAGGFIGRHLVRRLTADQAEVHAVDSSNGDISLAATWASLPQADVLIHLAAKSSVPASWDHPLDFIQANCLGIAHALEYCRRNGSKLIFLSSYMYGDAGSEAIAETAPVSTKNPYGVTKQFAEQLCNIYSDSLGVEARILRPFNVYGPEQSDAFLIPKIVREAKLGKVHVKDLDPRRDYVYVDDLVQAIVSLMDYAGTHRVFNIGSGRSYSVRDVIDTVETLLGTPVEVISDEVRRPGEVMDSVADIALARRELGWSPRYSLAQGLSQILDCS
jgi:nucleoside-diphosphate-sugar epimerase